MSDKQGLWESQAGRAISQVLKRGGINKAEGGRTRVGGRFTLESGYTLEHTARWKQIEITYNVGRWDKETNRQEKLNEIKALLEASPYDLTFKLYDDRVVVEYRTPFDQMKEPGQGQE